MIQITILPINSTFKNIYLTGVQYSFFYLICAVSMTAIVLTHKDTVNEIKYLFREINYSF